MSARIYRLTEIHQRIDEKLRVARKRRVPDQFEITSLKKMKLRVKDLINRMSPRTGPA